MGTKLEYDAIVRILEGLVKDYEKTVEAIDNCSNSEGLPWAHGYLSATIKLLRDIALEIDELIDYYKSPEELIEAVKKFIGTD